MNNNDLDSGKQTPNSGAKISFDIDNVKSSADSSEDSSAMPVFSINNNRSSSTETTEHAEQSANSDMPVFAIHDETDSQTASPVPTFDQSSVTNEQSADSATITSDSSLQSNPAAPQIKVQSVIPASSAPVNEASSQQSSNSNASSFAAVESEVVEQLRKANALPPMEPTTIDSSTTEDDSTSTTASDATAQSQSSASLDIDDDLKTSWEKRGEAFPISDNSTAQASSDDPVFPLPSVESEATDSALLTSTEEPSTAFAGEATSTEPASEDETGTNSPEASFDFDEPLTSAEPQTAPVFPTISGAGNSQNSVKDPETIPTREELHAENITATSAADSQAPHAPRPPRPKDINEVQPLIVNSDEVAEHKEKQTAQWQEDSPKRETSKKRRQTRSAKDSSVYKKSFLALLGLGNKDD